MDGGRDRDRSKKMEVVWVKSIRSASQFQHTCNWNILHQIRHRHTSKAPSGGLVAVFLSYSVYLYHTVPEEAMVGCKLGGWRSSAHPEEVCEERILDFRLWDLFLRTLQRQVPGKWTATTKSPPCRKCKPHSHINQCHWSTKRKKMKSHCVHWANVLYTFFFSRDDLQESCDSPLGRGLDLGRTGGSRKILVFIASSTNICHMFKVV